MAVVDYCSMTVLVFAFVRTKQASLAETATATATDSCNLNSMIVMQPAEVVSQQVALKSSKLDPLVAFCCLNQCCCCGDDGDAYQDDSCDVMLKVRHPVNAPTGLC